jgi:predicted metal-dependent hydrolase
VLPNDAIVEGKTIGEWSAEWWKWAFSLPTNQNPLLDPDGSNATNGQPFQSVFFIAGIYEASGAVTRKFSVPANSYLFLGPRNVEGDNVDVVPPLSAAEIRNLAAGFIDLVTELHVSIDGVPVTNLFDHRAISPVFSVNLPDTNNIYTYQYGHPVTGLIDPIVSDGYWVMIAPLPPGPHVIVWGSAMAPPFNFTNNIVDLITVLPADLISITQAIDELISQVRSSGLPAKQIEPLLDELAEAQKHLRRGKSRELVDDLRDFEEKVRKHVGNVDTNLAATLLASAEDILNALNRPAAGSLSQDVQELIASVSSLSNQHQNNLIEELREASQEFDRNHLRQGIRELREFQKKVRKEISDHTVADQLIAAAQKIVDVANQTQVGQPRKDDDEDR